MVPWVCVTFFIDGERLVVVLSRPAQLGLVVLHDWRRLRRTALPEKHIDDRVERPLLKLFDSDGTTLILSTQELKHVQLAGSIPNLDGQSKLRRRQFCLDT